VSKGSREKENRGLHTNNEGGLEEGGEILKRTLPVLRNRIRSTDIRGGARGLRGGGGRCFGTSESETGRKETPGFKRKRDIEGGGHTSE